MVPSILVEFASRPGAKVSCQFLSDLNSHDTGFHYQTVFFFSLESHVLTVNSCNKNFCVFVAGFVTLKNGKLNKEKKEGWGPSRRHRSNKYPLRMMNCNTNLYTPGQLDRVRKIIKNHHAIIFIKKIILHVHVSYTVVHNGISFEQKLTQFTVSQWTMSTRNLPVSDKILPVVMQTWWLKQQVKYQRWLFCSWEFA